MTRRGSDGILYPDSPRRIEKEGPDREAALGLMDISWAILAVFMVVLFVSMMFSFSIAMIVISLFLGWNVYLSIRMEEIMYTWITIRKKVLPAVYFLYLLVMVILSLMFIYLGFSMPGGGILTYL